MQNHQVAFMGLEDGKLFQKYIHIDSTLQLDVSFDEHT